jgi:chitodextrinase
MCLLALVAAPSAFAHHAVLEGTLVELHGHRLDRTEVGETYALRIGGRLHPLADAQPESLIGQRVRLDDTRHASRLQGRVRAAGEQRVAPAVAPGPRSLLAIIVTTPDETQAAASIAEVQQAVFTAPDSVNAFYKQQSEQATSFVGRVNVAGGDVVGPLAIAQPMTGCDEDALAVAADAAARTAGFAVDSYDHVLYVLPNSAECDWGGLGELPGTRTWTNGYLNTSVIAHELGHNLGAHHASSYSCTSGGAAVTLSPTCTSSEYGDPFDVMGLNARLMSSWHRAQIGQLPAGQELRLRAAQTVTLVSSDEFVAAGPRLLLVPLKEPRLPVTRWLSVELRSQIGPFDVWPAPLQTVTSGLSVRSVPNLAMPEQSQLLDAHPNTLSLADAPLPAGSTVSDAAHGVSITLNSVDVAARTADVTVTMPPLVDDVPPSAPTILALSGNSSAVALRWSAATDDEAIAGYDVERDGAVVGTTPGLTFDDRGVAALSAANYRVIAVDTSANRTASSALGAVLADVTPPSAVPGFAVTRTGGQVRAKWAAAQDNRAIGGYRVYRNGSSRGVIKGLSFSERPPAGRYTYSIAAIDTAGREGPRTAAAAVTVSASSVRPTIVLASRRKQGRVVTVKFTAKGATSLSAYRGSRRVGRASGTRLTVRVTLPRGVKRPTLKVVATSRAGSIARTFSLQR